MTFPARAVLFDMDGVVTDTAAAHEAAWKRMFDAYLAALDDAPGIDRSPFTAEDYRRHVDGVSRQDGVRRFLAARGIHLPEGSPEDTPEMSTLHGLGNRKNRLFLDWLAHNKVTAYPGTVRLLETLREKGIAAAVFSSSKNLGAVLESAGVRSMFDLAVDGNDLAALGLPGKPDPALLVETARRLGVDPADAAMVEDAIAGVEAGRRGGFGLVIGVARTGDRDALARAGADWVVADLAELALDEAGRLVRQER